LVHDLEEARAEAAQAMEEAEVLRQQLVQAAADKQKQEQYNEAMNQLVAADYFERAARSPWLEITRPPAGHMTRPS